MPLFRSVVMIGLLLCGDTAFAQSPPDSSADPQASETPTLDYDFFKAQVEPILTTKRDGHARCMSCHASVPRFRLRPPSPGAATWNEKDSRANFNLLRSRVVPGKPEQSRLLRHPLAEAAGGDPHHDGGKHWLSKDDPEWRTLAAWVSGATLANPGASAPGPLRPRIIQTNSAGDDVHIIDPATNKVVGRIVGIEANHGAAVAPDGGRIYISSEADATLDVVDARTLRVMTRIPLSGDPNNIAISRDGRRVYVAIHEEPGAVDVIDTMSRQRVKTIPIRGSAHNVYVTPDGRYVVAGSVAGKSMTIIDQNTEEPVWDMMFDNGVRPIAFEANRDGSTKRIFLQITSFNGFAVVDFAKRKEVNRIELPKLPPNKQPRPGASMAHGIAVSADSSRLVVNSNANSAVYVYSLPDLKLLGGVDVGILPDWVTIGPDGKTAYVANAGSDSVSVIDMVGLREVARIPVGEVPKRNVTAMLP